MKTILWVIGIFVIAVGAMFFLSQGNGTSLNPPLSINEIHPMDNIKGNASSTVVIYEYSDFQCPACRSYYPILRQVLQEYNGRAALVYRHFPLIGIHFNAEFAARAAEAAKSQGKFWEMHDLLFEKQDEWSNKSDVMPLFESYAELIGISVEQFRIDFNSEEVKNFVRAHRNFSTKIGLNSTPSFVINGKAADTPRSIEEFRSLINNSLKSQ